MSVIRPNAEPAATAILAGDIFLIDGSTGVRALAGTSVALRDANGNVALNNVVEGFASTATAGGTTTLAVTSAAQQFFTGTLAQTALLPVTSTLALGQGFFFQNSSTGAITVNSSGGNAVKVLAPGAFAIITCIALTGTTAASWQATYFGDIVVSGRTLTVNNSLALSGTDGTTMTFPATSATLARTDAGQTFTGTQAFGALTATTVNGLTVTASTGALQVGNGKTLTAASSLTLIGTDGTSMTFPSTSATLARIDAANTFTGTQTVGALVATTVNGNTFTTGTGVLTIAAAKTLTASNSLTLAGTDGSTINVGAGGTLGSNAFTSTAFAPLASLGSNAFTSTAFAPLASPTLTGTPAAPTAAPGTNTTQIASTAFVAAAVTAGTSGVSSVNGATGAVALIQKPQIRITLTQGTPVTSADVTGATSLFLEPYDGSQLSIYDGSANWVPLPVAASTYSLPATQSQSGTTHTNTVLDGLTDTSQMVVGQQVTGTNIAANSTIATITSGTAITLNNATTGSATNTMTFKLPPSTNYDVYGINNSGVPKLIWSAAWSNDTTPPTRVLQNGVEVASGATTKRLLGSVRTTTVAGQLEDSVVHRFVSNRYNAEPRQMIAVDPAVTWVYSLATIRQANANVANQLDYIATVPRSVVAHVGGNLVASPSGTSASVGIGVDSTTGNSAQVFSQAGIGSSASTPCSATYMGTPGLGRHFLAWLEFTAATASTTYTWLGTAPPATVSGMFGMVSN